MTAREEPQSDAPPVRPTGGRRRMRPGPEVRERRRRILTYVLWAGAVVLTVNAVVGENGYLATLRARREQAALAADVARIQLENQRLKEQARRLDKDPIAVEEAARRQLNLIRPGETLVIIRDAKPAAQ